MLPTGGVVTISLQLTPCDLVEYSLYFVILKTDKKMDTLAYSWWTVTGNDNVTRPLQVFHPSTPILTNDLKKGAKVLLRSGWEADMWDNMKGNARVALVYGFETEAGSVYAWDILAVKKDEKWYKVTHTEKQLKQKSFVNMML